MLLLKTSIIAGIFCCLSSLSQAQSLNTMPNDSLAENDLLDGPEMTETPASAIPDAVNIGSLNTYYTTWDNQYVRRYSEPGPDARQVFELPLLNSYGPTFVMPVVGEFLSPFGYRGRRTHTGVDIRLAAGDPVVAAFDGVVRMAKWYSGYGNCIVVRHYNGLETLYGHLSKIEVQVNQMVSAGQQIGLGGRTGRATCNHLHFETRFMGKPFNPKIIIDFNTHQLNRDTLLVSNRTFGLQRDYLPWEHQDLADADINNRPVTSGNHRHVHHRSKAKSASGKFHTVRKGDTLSEIAEKHNTTVKKLCAANGIKSGKKLKPGAKLKVK